MGKILKVMQRGMLYISALVLVASYPFSAMADTQEPATTDPTAVTEPAPQPELTYTYNPDTQTWDSEEWKFNPQTGTYEKPPAPIIIEPPASQASDTTAATQVEVTNTVTSDATSGNSAVTGNHTAGSAGTGDAAAIATLINTVNSSLGTGDNKKVATFTHDILGDVKGDIVLHPMILKAFLEAEAEKQASTVNAQTNFDVTNNMMIGATSGNATVDSNTKAGDATTGSAYAVANVVNILNSLIAAQDSFIGTINIYGNLEGDILIAPDFIPQMLASNKDNEDTSHSLQVSKQDTTDIVNSISAVAETGAASVFNNTSAGSATTGDALSNIVLFNLSGHDIIAKNSLLVFVNVLGKWVGVIVDAPADATAALLGNEVTSNTKYAPDLTVNAETNHGITNNITVKAQSGDATVSNNTEAGNAKTGSAKAMANVANLSNSSFGLSDWFGILFINVFQSWHGSLALQTMYGNENEPSGVHEQGIPVGPVQFIPSGSTAPRVHIFDSRTIQTEASPQADQGTPEVLAAATKQVAEAPKSSGALVESSDYRLWIIAGSILVAGASIIGIRRLFNS